MEYKFPQPVTPSQCYRILKKAAKVTNSRLVYSPGVYHSFDSEKNLEQISVEKSGGNFSKSNLTVPSLEFRLETDFEDEEPRFSSIELSKFVMQDFPSDELTNYVNSLINAIEDAYKKLEENTKIFETLRKRLGDPSVEERGKKIKGLPDYGNIRIDD
jgi:hypothetical protein